MDVATYSNIREITLFDFEFDGESYEGSFRARFDGQECPHRLWVRATPKKRLLVILPMEPYRHTEMLTLVEISPEAHDALQKALDACLPSKQAQVLQKNFEFRVPVGPPASLGCPGCKERFTIQKLLDHSNRAWPNQMWILFTCPTCQRDSHLFFFDRQVAIGGIDGAPGPCFMPNEIMDCPRLWVDVRAGRIECVFGSRLYTFGARKPAHKRSRKG